VAKRRVQKAQRASRSNSTWWIVIGVVVVVALAAIIAFAVSGGETDIEGGSASPSGGTVVPEGDLSYGQVQVEGTALPQLSRGGADTAAGDPIPTINGEAFDGSAISIATDGKPKVVMALAHWCPHCRAEVPRIQGWLDDSGMPGDVELYAIATGTSPAQPNFPPGEWLRDEGWSVPTLVDSEENTAARALGLSSYPFFVVVDASGNVVLRTSGELNEEQWQTLLEAARTGSIGGTGVEGESSPAG
jgi:thiol-disulfide isomerase/thioredoxin